MRRQEQDAAPLGARRLDDGVVIRHHFSQALFVAKPHLGHFQDHGPDFAGGAPGEGGLGIAGLGGIGPQAVAVFAGKGIRQPSQQPAGRMQERQRQGRGHT
ncbi:Uncharacterised protein [Bordetella pertussis]|nr:Uncharacterised protein [Bordetella pertussis]